MSQENVEIVKGLVRAFRAGEWDQALRVYDEAAELDLTRLPGGGVYRGPDGVRDFFTRWVGSWEQFEAEPLEFIDQGDVVIAVMRIRAVGRGSGAPVTMRSADVYTVADGRVVRQVGYPNADEVLEARLSE
jgi:ketosteroid isomerase-like protein